MSHAAINGFQMHYQLHGDEGEPLVLVHGYTGDVGDWFDQTAEFSTTHRVLVMDHRGHGISQGPADRESYTITQMADDIEALVEHVGFDRYHLVGHSMGGAVSQEIALRSAHRLMSLTLFGCGTDFALRSNATVAAYMEKRNRMAEEQGMAALAAMPSSLPDPPHMPAGRRDYEKARMEKMSVHGLIGGWNALMTWDGTTDRIKNVSVPSLIMSGELDMAVKGSKYMHAQIAGSTLLIIPEAGHCPEFERPEIFNAALREHLLRNAGASVSETSSAAG
jgi:3-oxoadipate enol-lactonase